MHSFLRWRPLAAALLAVAVFVAGCAGQSSLPKVGQPAPDLTLTMLDGSKAKLSDFRGKVVLVNFWATYCPPCQAEMPALEAVYKEVAEKGGVVLAIDQKESPETVQGFVDEFKLTFPVALDEEGAAGAIYGLTGIPESFIVDRDGVLRYKTIGQMDEETIRRYLSSLL